MRIDILTLFPDMCKSVYTESITGRAIKKGVLEVYSHDIRDYTKDKHKNVDDAPYGGGQGMIMAAQPVYDCFLSLCGELSERPYFVYMSPAGQILNQKKALELSNLPNLAILCGHYEGVDERVIEKCVDEEISIGDYVLTGGELPALVLTDCIARMIPGVLSSEDSFMDESHFNGLLEYPQYTKPAVWEGMEVPSVLLSGHHANIEKWRKEKSLERTKLRRPDLL